MNPEFSVIVPVYNVEKYLDECIRSVISQKDFDSLSVEIVLVNDGSTDNSGRLCDEYAAKYDFIRVVHQENKGLLQARRAGFKAATGDYVINLDSDDYLNTDALSELDKVICQDDPDIVFYNMSLLEDGNIRPYYSDVFTSEHRIVLSKDQVIEAYFRSDVPVVTSLAGKLIRRSCIEANRDYSSFGRLSCGEDTLQTAEVVSNASKFVYLNHNVYIYRLGSGMTAKFDPEYYSTFKKIFNCIMKYKCFADNGSVEKLYNEKILSTGCRAITQSKANRKMSYADRKKYIISIVDDADFSKALRETDLGSSVLSKKYKMIIRFVKMRAFFLLHIASKIL